MCLNLIYAAQGNVGITRRMGWQKADMIKGETAIGSNLLFMGNAASCAENL